MKVKVVIVFIVASILALTAEASNNGKYSKPDVFQKEVKTALAITQGRAVTLGEYRRFTYVAHNWSSEAVIGADLEKHGLRIEDVEKAAVKSRIVPGHP